MEVTQIIIDGDGFDSKDDQEFVHSVRQYYAYRCVLTLNYFRVFLHTVWTIPFSDLYLANQSHHFQSNLSSRQSRPD